MGSKQRMAEPVVRINLREAAPVPRLCCNNDSYFYNRNFTNGLVTYFDLRSEIMTTLHPLCRAALAGMLLFSAGVASAQHDVAVGGGSTKDVATGESTSRAPVTRRAPTRTTPAKPRATRTTTPVRRGTTAHLSVQRGSKRIPVPFLTRAG